MSFKTGDKVTINITVSTKGLFWAFWGLVYILVFIVDNRLLYELFIGDNLAIMMSNTIECVDFEGKSAVVGLKRGLFIGIFIQGLMLISKWLLFDRHSKIGDLKNEH